MLRPQSANEIAFRAELRGWLEANLPQDLRDLTFRAEPARIMPWCRALAQRGWLAPHWPRAQGGMGATPVQQVILFEEQARIGAPDYPSQGLNQIGPILQRFGSDAQKALHLPRILAGEVIWCQGYSEPGAGSDLASLRTRAVVDGETLMISGQKIWTTWGHHADWMYALVRTDPDKPDPHASARDGITFVLINMATPGISRRPITTIADDDEFAEVFFDDVRVPIGNIVGGMHQGWQVATALLGNERATLGSPYAALRAMERVRRLARLLGDAIDPVLMDRIAAAAIEVETLTAAFLDTLEAAEAGAPVESSYLKILGTEATMAILDILQDLAGNAAALHGRRNIGGSSIDISELYMQSRRLPIYGGSNEIQRSLIASRVLRLPRGRG